MFFRPLPIPSNKGDLSNGPWIQIPEFPFGIFKNALFQKLIKSKFCLDNPHQIDWKSYNFQFSASQWNQAQQCDFNIQTGTFQNWKHEIALPGDRQNPQKSQKIPLEYWNWSRFSQIIRMHETPDFSGGVPCHLPNALLKRALRAPDLRS